MPRDLKMRIKSLLIMEAPAFDLLKPLIHESSFPLETLKMCNNFKDERKMDYDFLRKSKLFICNFSAELPFIQNLRNQIVHFPYTARFIQNEDFIVLIRSWVETKKPIGTCFTFSSYHLKEDVAIQIMNKVKDRFVNSTVVDNKCVNIPMGTHAALKISYFQNASSLSFRMTVETIEQI
uniref:FBA_2 domain-containing protein n=1 Tax=Caenorhabditis tropicalis TaxID=1561998 RepID=A0A1I7TAH7_9PELO